MKATKSAETAPLYILNKREAMYELLNDACDVADDDVDTIAGAFGSGSDSKVNMVYELNSFIHSIHNLYIAKPDSKYVVGDGFPVHALLPIKMSKHNYHLVVDLYHKLMYYVDHRSELSFHDFGDFYKKYQLQANNCSQGVYNMLQPLINALCGKWYADIPVTTCFDLVAFPHDTIDPSNTQVVRTDLIDRLLFIIDCYKSGFGTITDK